MKSGINPTPAIARPPAPPAPPAIRIAAEHLGAADHAAQRERLATAAMQGLLASTPAATQVTSNFDQYATRAVRYADALIEALNRSTAEAMTHARQR